MRPRISGECHSLVSVVGSEEKNAELLVGRPLRSRFFESVGDIKTPEDRGICTASSSEMTMKFDPQQLQSGLRRSWSLSTARQWTPGNPAAGQCNVTALLVHELYGGDLLKTPLPGGDHFYNRIEGRRYDFTASQFDQPIAYMDLPTSPTDARRGTTSDELAELRTAFLRQASTSG